jgi:hypothetical protein
MKASDKILGTVILALFVGSGLLKTAERIFLFCESGYGNTLDSKAEKSQTCDSTCAVAPGDGVKWNRVTLGLRRSIKRGIIEDGSIFKDIHLDYFDHGAWNQPFFKPYQGSEICCISFEYLNAEPDSVKEEPAEENGYHFIFIHITKYKPGHRPDAIHEYIKINKFKAIESPPGVWSYRTQNDFYCEWFAGSWLTQIDIPLYSCGNDSAKTLELRDQIRDRLFAYYKTLR